MSWLVLPAVAGRPVLGIFQKAPDLGGRRRREVALVLGDGERVPPGREPMQGDAPFGERGDGLREDAVVKDHEAVRDFAARRAQRLDEVQLGAAVGRQVLDQKDARAFGQMPFDLGVAAEALGLLAHVDHRQVEAFGDPGGEGDAGGLAAGNAVDRRMADLGLDLAHREIHQGPAGFGERR